MWIETLLFVVILILWNYLKEPKGFPPGPRGLPLVGYMPFLTSHPARKCLQLSRKYGDVLGITIGSYKCVVLNSESAIREALKEMSFSGRPQMPFLNVRSGGKKKGVLFGEGKEWHEQRRFVLKNLRDFGFGKKSMEQMIQEEASDLVSRFRSLLDRPVELGKSFNVAVVNSLWAMVAGERMAHDDPRILLLVDKLVTSIRSNFIFAPRNFIPWLSQYFPWMANQLGKSSSKVLSPFMQDVIKSHRATYDANHPRDLVDMYIKEIDECKDANSSFYAGPEAELMLKTVLLDLFVAGTETTSTTLRWAILHILRNPSVQTKVQAELDSIVGRSRLPSLQDRPNLPYTDATLMEVQRMASLLTFSVFHSTTEDVTFRGHLIPKDTIVLPNLYAMLHNPDHWSAPEMFRPERFLSEDGKVKKDPHLVPFSMGRRVCLGETLARESLFLFFTSMLQNFTFTTVPGEDVPNPEDSYMGLVTIPKPFSVIMHERGDK